MRLWGLKNCDTCRKALADLRAAGHVPRVTDIREDGLQVADIERFYEVFGEALVNRRSTTWRGLGESDQAGNPVDLIAANPTLMKRPVIEENGRLTLGWDAKTRSGWLGIGNPTA